jgi:phosphohistidine swiveling domain-containing protein
MSRYIVDLDSRAALQETRAGGKGANIARLRRQGFRVPPGFVIVPTAFQNFLADFDIETLTQRRDWGERDLERIQEMLMVCRIPDRLTRPIDRAYHRLGGPVAVRSSMVGEDADLASFAGQLDTVLNVAGTGEILQAVRQCWVSVFNPRLLDYLAGREADSSSKLLEDFAIAVVVQRMVDAEAAGVAFSVDPATGQRCVVIEAVRGLGEALVQGLAEPDRYLVDERGVLAKVRCADADRPILQDAQILQLAETAREVAGRARAPQDIEWAWDGKAFHLLQCRPITSLVGRRIYSNRMVSDMSPGLVKPLVYSTKTVAMASNVFGQLFTQLIGPNDIDFATLVKRIHSRIYTDITLLSELFEQIGMPANFFQMIARDERSDFRRPPLTLKAISAIVRLFRFTWRHARPADEIEAFLERHHQQLEPFRKADWSAITPQALLRQFDALMALHDASQWFILIVSLNMTVRNRLLNQLVNRWAQDVTPGNLIRGLVGLKALEPNKELRHLATQARALEGEVQRLLIEADDHTIRAGLSQSEEGRALVHGVNAFLSRYGFLSANGTDFTATPWGENSTLIWHAIGRMAASPVERTLEDAEAIREGAKQRVQASLNWAWGRLFERLLASTITYIDLRERVSLTMSEDSYQMRRLLLALADHLATRGDLGWRDDVFYLDYDELQQLVVGELDGDAARRSVAARKAEMEADAQIELPDTICGDHIPTRPLPPMTDHDFLVGIPGSPGVSQGFARVIRDPSEAPTALGQKDILVVPFTDVGWTPLFSGVGGIVAETGGQLSHTSIVAREYGLPAVVSVRQATSLIQEGQFLTVDGNRGRVYLKHVVEP